MNILGLNSFFEHPAAALIVDGELAFAAEEERFTRIKHGCRYSPYRTFLPVNAIHAALATVGICSEEIGEVAYSYDRWLHLRSLWGCFTGHRRSSLREELSAFVSASHVRDALRSGFDLPDRFRDRLRPFDWKRARYRAWNHHLCHAASTFYCSGFDRSLVVVADGSGEVAATSVYLGKGARLRKVGQVDLPHSLGILYSMVTRHLGFEAFSDEFKVMGLAAYGKASYRSAFADLVRLGPRGTYRIDQKLLNNLESILGAPRAPWAPLSETHHDVACSLQECLERALLHVVDSHLEATGADRLCVAGGTFMNCIANGKLAERVGEDRIFVQPAAHDAGTAIGAAILSWIDRGGSPAIAFGSAALGTRQPEEVVESLLRQGKLPFRRLDDAALARTMASRLAEDQIGGLFRGRMEFGSRALGNRSILASARDPSMRDRLNRVKGREGFRPVAPVVTAEGFGRLFRGAPNRYMAIAVEAREEAKRLVPAAVHVDGSARAQVVDRDDDPFLHALLCEVERRCGVPLLINTSLNVRGQPIVESVPDALTCLFTTEMSFLAIGPFLIEKARALAEPAERLLETVGHSA